MVTGKKKGFTLIELLIVVVIIGILAAIAIPKFSRTKEKAYVASMKADLRNLATYEESYAADNNGSYFDGVATSTAPLNEFQPSANIEVTASLETTASGAASWSAAATHTLTNKTCSSSAEGQITCVDAAPAP